MYVLGDEAENVLMQFPTAPTTYVGYLNSFEDYFIPRRNLIFERFKLSSRMQHPGEPVEKFIRSLHTLAEHCCYGALKDELIHDRIVIGVLDRRTSDRLHLKADLTLQDCITMVKQAEQQAAESREMQNSSHGNSHIAGIQGKKMKNYKAAKQSDSTRAESSSGKEKRHHLVVPTKGKGNICQFCSHHAHPREKCPADGADCRKCGKRGRWATVCKSKVVNNLRTNSDLSGGDFDRAGGGLPYCLGSIQANEFVKEWNVPIKVAEFGN